MPTAQEPYFLESALNFAYADFGSVSGSDPPLFRCCCFFVTSALELELELSLVRGFGWEKA